MFENMIPKSTREMFAESQLRDAVYVREFNKILGKLSKVVDSVQEPEEEAVERNLKEIKYWESKTGKTFGDLSDFDEFLKRTQVVNDLVRDDFRTSELMELLEFMGNEDTDEYKNAKKVNGQSKKGLAYIEKEAKKILEAAEKEDEVGVAD